MSHDIVDVAFIAPIDTLYPGWCVWEVDATLEDGSIVHGIIQGDGIMGWANETFEPDEE